MTPTVLHMVGFAKPTAFSLATGCVSAMVLDEIIDPPKNVAGKQCIVTATYCDYETSKPLTTTNRANQHAYFSWNLNSLWSHIYTSLNTPFLQPGLGVKDIEFGRYYDLGSRVVRIPDGPFPVKLLCRTQNLNDKLTEPYDTADKNNYLILTVVLHLTPVE